jgi:drug/metabolite transporter (DMT)-like permease
LVGFAWGIPYLLIRVAVREIAQPTLVFFRTAPAALLLLPFALRSGNLQRLLTRWRAIIAYTVAELGLSWLMLFRAEQRLSSSLSGLLIAMVPFISVLLGKAFHDPEPIGRTRLTGLIIGLIGVVTLVGTDIRGSALLAVGEIVVTAVSYAFGPMIVGRYLRELPGLEVVTASLVLTALAYSPFALTHLPGRLNREVVSSVVVLVVLCTAIAFIAFYALIQEVGAARATVVTYVNPAVAIVLGVLVLNERFTVGVALGFPLVLVGSYLATTTPKLALRHREAEGNRVR